MFQGQSSQRLFGLAGMLLQAHEADQMRRQRRYAIAAQELQQRQEEARNKDPEEFMSDGEGFPYEAGKIFLGENRNTGELIGAHTPKNLLTVGETRAGKDQCKVLMNLAMNASNALVVDPKAEGVNLTASIRTRLMGHTCYVIDPLGVADAPDAIPVNIDLLANLKLDDPEYFEKLDDLTAGVVMRTGEEREPYFKNAAEDIFGAYITALKYYNPDGTTFATVIDAINRPGEINDKNSRFGAVIEAMREIKDPRFRPRILQGIAHFESKAGNTVRSELNTNLGWLGYDSMRRTLGSTTLVNGEPFSFKLLTQPNTTIFIVIPRNRLTNYSGFLRLMASQALEAVYEYGDNDLKTLFILNEFAALGALKKIQKECGAMPSSGIKLWPILQNWGQMITAYGSTEAHTFYGTCGIASFMGCIDQDTCEFVADQMGRNPISKDHLMDWRKVKEHLMIRDGIHLARRSLTFLSQGQHVLSLKPRPFFQHFGNAS